MTALALVRALPPPSSCQPCAVEGFAHRYRAKLEKNESGVERLLAFARHGPVTLLYAAHDETHNHAVVLAGYLHHLIEHGGGAAVAPQSRHEPRGGE